VPGVDVTIRGDVPSLMAIVIVLLMILSLLCTFIAGMLAERYRR
jgi:hypothetical protein